jgi:hypothetical protein
MAVLHGWFPLSRRSKRAIVASVCLSILYTGIVFAYSVHPATNVSISGTLWHALLMNSVLAFGTVGIPVLLWLRYDVRSPSFLLTCILLFWHILVEFPPIGSGQGDSPGFLFVFVGAPFYLVAYGLLAGGEVWLRRRDRSTDFSSA